MVETIPGFCLWEIDHPQVRKYIRQVLSTFSEKEYLLPALLLGAHDVDEGRVIVSWPCEATEADILNFGYGGDKRAQDTFFSNYVREYLQADPTHVCVIDEVNLRRSGITTRDEPVAYFLQEQVYFLVRGMDLPQIDLPWLLAASGYVFHAVYTLTSLASPADLPTDRQLSASVLQTLAERAEVTCIGTYDGRGELIWEKHASSLIPDRIVSGD